MALNPCEDLPAEAEHYVDGVEMSQLTKYWYRLLQGVAQKW